MSWPAQMAEAMVLSKDLGLDFETSWRAAVSMHPPRGRDVGPERPTLLGDDDESLVEFFRRAAEDAWYGRRPLLAHLPSLVDMLAEEGAVLAVDGVRPSAHARMVA